MSILSKEKLLEEADFRYETFEIGPLGGEVMMREFSVQQRLDIYRRFQAASKEDDEEASMRALVGLVVFSLCNDDRTQMFPTIDEQNEAVDALLKRKTNASIEQLIKTGREFHGLDAAAVEQAVGNSEASLSGSSRTGSQETSDASTSTSSPSD